MKSREKMQLMMLNFIMVARFQCFDNLTLIGEVRSRLFQMGLSMVAPFNLISVQTEVHYMAISI
jgi:hypothetical protein